MLISTFYERLPIYLETGKSVYGQGSSGMGKTSLIVNSPAIVKKATGRDIGIVIINAFTYTPMHMLGFGVAQHHQTHVQMVFSDPFFWITSDGRRLEDYKDGGFIVVDEADKGDLDLLKILIEMGNSGRVGTHQLPPGWVVIFLANPNDARYGSKKMLDYCLNRVTLLPLQSDPDYWAAWGARVGLLPHTLSFASETESRSLVFSDELPPETRPWCTQRSLHRTDHMLQTEMRLFGLREPPEHEHALEEAEGTIGTTAAQLYFQALRKKTGMPTVAAVVADPTNAPLPDHDCRHLFCYNAAYAVTATNLASLIKYVDRLPKEYATTFMRAAMNRNPKLVVNPAVGKWAQTNAQLVMLLNRYAPSGA